jgi:uncharacterized protein
MLQVEIGALDRGPVEVSGQVAGDDPLFDDVEFEFGEPVRVSGRVSSAGLGRFYWRGRIATTVDAACPRCLAPTRVQVDRVVDVVFTEDQDTEDPSEYVILEGATVLDLRDAVREELILGAEQYVLCREDCKGLCPTCGTDLNVNSCDCRPPPDVRWAALEALNTKPDE